MNKSTQDIQDILTEYIKKNDTIILGLSGGPDSIFLLQECLKFSKKSPIKIVVAHINHKLRGKESDKEEQLVKKIAQKFDLEFELHTLDKIPKGNLEEQCRIKRYTFFEKIRKKYKAKWILTAHHHNDNIETIILNLVRGSFIDGLSGMDLCDKSRHLLRPLLFITKNQILSDLKKHKIRFCTDASNQDLIFSRNRIRHNVIPELKTINEGLEQIFYNNIINFKELQNYIDKKTNSWLKTNYKKNDRFLHQKFIKLDPIIQKSILSQIYKKKYGSLNKFNQSHLNQILKILHQPSSNKKKEFGNNYFIQVQRSKKDGLKYIALIPV